MKKHLPAVIVTLFALALLALGGVTVRSCFAWKRNPAVAFLLKNNPDLAGKVHCTSNGFNRDTDAYSVDCETDSGGYVYCNSGGAQSEPYCKRVGTKPGSEDAKAIEAAEKKQAEAKEAADAKAAADAAKAKADADAAAKLDVDAKKTAGKSAKK